MNEAWVYSIGTLFFGLFHLAALTLAIVNWKQYPTVCLLVLAGSLLNLSAIGARIALPTIWFQLFHDRLIFAFLNLGISLVNLSGSALYLIAIFAERSSYPARHPLPRDDDDWDRRAAFPGRGRPEDSGT
jgi:hypothetical protein